VTRGRIFMVCSWKAIDSYPDAAVDGRL